ncbi:MAG: CBS domain-containing protein, partial [Promethearchaeota archaeon]
ARKTAISDAELLTDVIDYGVPRRDRPKLRQISYEEMKSGYIELNGKKVKCSPLSSFYYANKIAETLKEWIQKGEFLLNPPAETLPTDTVFKPMKITSELKFVKDLKKKAETCYDDCDIKAVAEKIVRNNVNHIVIIDRESNLKGIVTSFDITKAIAEDKHRLDEIVTKRVITTTDNDPLDVAARKMKVNEISALPVVNDQKKVVGIISSEELM